MRVDAKLCGILTDAALDAALAGGASHIGLVFFARSPRAVTIEQAAALARRASGQARVVGLFVDPAPGEIKAVRARVPLQVVQLHGSEPPEQAARFRSSGMEVWKAVPVRTRADLASAHRYLGAVDRILFDAKPPAGAELPGGNGLRFDWTLLDGFEHRSPWVLSGGLDADNVADAVGITGASMVDVSSGIESAPGIKDVDKIAAFLQAVARL